LLVVHLDALSLGKHDSGGKGYILNSRRGNPSSRLALNLYITLHVLREADIEQSQILWLVVELAFMS